MTAAEPNRPVHPELAGRSCYHKYEVVPGLYTPGLYLELDPQRCLDELGVPRDLAGLRALDIGAFDGPLTFELERRGAAVTGLDIQDADITVFNAVKAILGAKAECIQCSVYDATPEALGTFDVVVFAGVYYHLKNPVLALQRIRRLLRDGGRLFIEGAAASDYLGRELLAALDLPASRAAAVTEALDRMPISYFDIEQKVYKNWSNWWFPTTGCLKAMLRDCGFRDVDLSLKPNAFYSYSHRRLMGAATADPAKPDPDALRHENGVLTEDPTGGRLIGNSGRPQGPLARLRDLARELRRRFR